MVAVLDVELFSFNPAGSAPAEIDQLKGAVPLGAVQVSEYRTPTADGPLVPQLTLKFARWISDEYLAPPATTLRSMLPPGMLERLELVADVTYLKCRQRVLEFLYERHSFVEAA